jgi:hypothetical protein
MIKKISEIEKVLSEAQIKSIAIYLSKIKESEKMEGTFTFANGKTKSGYSINNNDLSGEVLFSNSEEDAPISEFIESFKDNAWSSHVQRFIDKFDGQGRSIEYEYDEYEEFEEGNSDGCEYEARVNPTTITIVAKKRIELKFEGNDIYSLKKDKIKKADLIKIISKKI